MREDDLKWKLTVLTLILGGGIIAAAILFQHNYYAYPTKADLTWVQIADSESYHTMYSISDSATQGDYINISGHVVHTGEDLKHFNVQLVLYGDSLEDALIFKLAMQTRTDVTAAFNDGYNYDSSGFSANIKRSLIGDAVYNVALLYNDTQNDDGARLIITGNTFVCEVNE